MTPTIKSAFADSNLAFCLLLPTLLLFPDIPRWSFFSSIIFWFYRIMIDKMEWKNPSRFVSGFFSLVFLGITYLTFDSFIGREPSCAFLVVLLSLKILEYRSEEENGFLILLGFYLVTAKFLFDTSFVWFSLGFPTMILLIYFLLPKGFRQKNNKAASIFVLKSLLISLPFGLFLFFYFPRFSSEIFVFKQQNNKIQNIGFSDTIEPGSVSSLVENDEIVLRAKFIGVKPSINTLYWRGLTLTKPKGLVWSRDSRLENDAKLSPYFSTEEPHVQVTLEPTDSHWIFSLDQTTDLNSTQTTIYKLPMGIYKSEALIENRLVYNLKFRPSQTRLQDSKDSTIALPPPSAEIKKLLKELSLNSHSPDDIVNNISEYLVKNQFQYTLSPGDQGELSLEEFLFKTKQGFCEHYASSAALLLNYLKIPARVIAGYHGGEYNPIGRFWTLRQKDAHAWVEYLDQNHQWKRFDPTAVIAPMRLALGANDYARMYNADVMNRFSALNLSLKSNSIVQEITFFFEDLNYRWNSAIVNFDIEKQKKLLKEMNISIAEAIIYGMLMTLVLALTLSWLLRNRISISRSERIFLLINKYMERFDLEKKPTEGPDSWRQRTLNKFPEQSRKIQALFDCYIAEAYENKPSQSNLKRVKQLLRSL